MSADTSGAGPDLPGMRCIRLIGSGGFADVYLYEREHPKGQVAVKVLKSAGLDEARRRQFADEADAMAALDDHPYIAPVYSAGTAPDGRPYLVMQYYPTRDLASRIAEQPLSVAETLKIGIQLCGAVESAHLAELIHRDIKPSNIMLTTSNWPALSDFGIAGKPNAAGTGDMNVSVAWSPREVLTARSDGSATSDVYSLAATLWNALTGRAPFEVAGGDNSDMEMLRRIVNSRPPAIARDDVPASLERLLTRALSREPSQRPQSAAEFGAQLKRIEDSLKLGPTEMVVHRPRLDRPVGETRSRAGLGDLGDLGGPVAEARTSAGPTVQKPLAVVGGVQSAAPVQSTRQRAVPVTEAQAEPAPAARPARWKRLALIAAGVAVVGTALGVGLSLAGGGKNAPVASAHDSTHDSATPSATDTDVLPNDGAARPDPQRISSTRDGASVVFTWAPVTGVQTYEWSVADANGAAIGAPHRGPETHATVPAQPSGRTCITVHSVTPGAPITPGTLSCGT